MVPVGLIEKPEQGRKTIKVSRKSKKQALVSFAREKKQSTVQAYWIFHHFQIFCQFLPLDIAILQSIKEEAKESANKISKINQKD